MMNAKINGIKLGFDVTGQNSPALLLMHGFGLDRSIWYELVEKHLGDQQVVLPDLRGHGESDAPLGPYDMSFLAQDMEGLLESLGIEQAIVCGHSMGGYVALAFAELFPAKLAGLGLITTNAKADSAEKRAGRYALVDDICRMGSIAVAESLAPRLSRNPAVIRQAHELICQCDPAGLIGSLQGMAVRPDRSTLLPEINVPALVVAGEEDLITRLESAEGMASALPMGAFTSLPGVGHMPMVEDASGLAEALRTLIKRVNC
jgi:pimeloyl-ACP methyl ester carboxylesterase